jgi:hypothetical protein
MPITSRAPAKAGGSERGRIVLVPKTDTTRRSLMIITLCGDPLESGIFLKWNEDLTLSGHLVFSIAPPAGQLSPFQQSVLDLVHLAKIEQSRAIVVLNVDESIDEATRRQVEWAKIRGKDIFWIYNPIDEDQAWGADARVLLRTKWPTQ